VVVPLLFVLLLNAAGVQEQASAIVRQGDGYRASRQYDRAIVEYSDAIKADPRSADAYFNRGLSYEAIGSDRSALEDFTSVIRIGGTRTASAFERRATIYVRMGARDRAAADYERAMKLDPRSAEALYGSGITRRRAADLAAARALRPGIASEMAARGVK
jgi:tetratricopeptide (TPR) repeat protein